MFCRDLRFHPKKLQGILEFLGRSGRETTPEAGEGTGVTPALLSPGAAGPSPAGAGRRRFRALRVRIGGRTTEPGFSATASPLEPGINPVPSPRRAQSSQGFPEEQPKPRLSPWPRAEPALFLATSLKFKLICYLSN